MGKMTSSGEPRGLKEMQLLIIGFAIGIADKGANADFAVTAWTLTSGVRDLNAGPGHSDLAVNTTVQSPFTGNLDAAYANSISQAGYQYNWDLTTGQFNNAAHIEAQGGPDFLASIDNLVRITPTTDVLLTVDAQWTFQLGGGDRSSFLTILAGQLGSPLLMNWNYQSSPIFGGPTSATWTVHDSVLLPAGGNYRFRCIFRFDSFSGSPAVLSTGTGFANFTLTTVPEPAAILPFAITALQIRRRSAHRP